jgi:TonB-linked SusC/RagA family outer membrane protein
MNKNAIRGAISLDNYHRILKIMKIAAFFLFLGIFISHAGGSYSQGTNLTLNLHSATIREVCEQIEKQSNYIFVFSDNAENELNKKINISSNSENIEDLLKNVFSSTGLKYKILDKQIVVYHANEKEKEISVEPSPAPQQQQTKTIRGRITDEKGEAIIGANVIEVGTSNGTVTDINGNFSLQVKNDAKIRISYVGYLEQEINTAGKTNFNIILREDIQALEEVVVVGYGIQRKESLTGAISMVKVDEVLGSRPIADIGRGIQGTVPGLFVVVPTGEVGSDPVMKIRGQIGSIQGSSNPLILVDNVEIPSIQLINPNDIESITVLKDAAASSIYGSKAAFGVILITTKKGAKTEKTEITYSSNFSWQSPFKKIDIAGIDGLEYTLEAHENMKGSGPAGGFWRVSRESFEKVKEWQEKYGGIVGKTDPVVYNRDWIYDGVDKYGYRIYDPVSVMVKDNALTQTHNFSLNGKRRDTDYNLSFGYLDQEGMTKPAKHDDFIRFTSNLSLSTKVTDFLTLRGGAMYSDATKRYPNSPYGFQNDPWLYLYRWSRLFPTGVQEHGEDVRDPYFDVKKSHDLVKKNRYTNLNAGATIDFMPNWDLKIDYAYTSRINSETSSLPTFTGAWHWYAPIPWVDETGNQIYVDEIGNVTQTGGVPAYRFPVTQYITKDQTYFYKNSYTSEMHTVNAYSTYDLNLENAHKFKFMLGTNIISNKWNSHWSRKSELIDNDNPQFNFAVGTETVGGDANWDSQVGFFGRTNYSFLDKYLLEANLRYDATSKFPSDLRWRWYPSFSGGWVLSNENFMAGLDPILSFAKVRASWGIIGDQSVPNSLYLATMDITKNSWLSSGGEQFFQLGTPRPISAGISWQDIESLNIGADLRFFNNKLGLVLEWFQRDTKNMIIPGESLPATYGDDAPQGNFGNLRTRGWEVALDFSHRFDNGLRISLNANVADAITDITKGPDWATPYENRRVDDTYATGKRYGDIYGYVTDRLYQKDDFLYDEEGNFLQTTIIYEGVAKRTNMLAGKNPVYQTYFEDGNQILLVSPGDVKFVDVDGDGYITPGKNTFGDPGDRVVIGNSTPRYEYGFRAGADYKSFDFSLFLQGIGKRKIWGRGQLAIPGYHPKDGGMPQAIAKDFWKKDRTNAFYPRAWNLGGADEGFIMRKQTRYMLNMAYLRIKNITLGYTLPPKIAQQIYLSHARLYLSLENPFTFDKLRGLPIDPETISGYSTLKTDGNYNLGRTGVQNPVFKSASFGIQITL